MVEVPLEVPLDDGNVRAAAPGDIRKEPRQAAGKPCRAAKGRQLDLPSRQCGNANSGCRLAYANRFSVSVDSDMRQEPLSSKPT